MTCENNIDTLLVVLCRVFENVLKEYLCLIYACGSSIVYVCELFIQESGVKERE